MKRAAAGLAGFAFGLFLTWLCIYAFNQIDWARARGPVPGGCIDRGDCAWWTAPILLGYVFLFPLLFGALNAAAWRRWTVRRWGGWFLTLSVLTAMLHLAAAL